jgi:hypothetical protein
LADLAHGYYKQWMQACLVISFAVGFLLFAYGKINQMVIPNNIIDVLQMSV